MYRLLMPALSLLAVATASLLPAEAQLAKRQLPTCAGYGSVCRLDFTTEVNPAQDEFYTQDGDFCTCPVGTCSVVFISNGTEIYDLYMSVPQGGTSGIYICRD